MKMSLMTVVYFGATWATFKPKLKKINKNLPPKNSCIPENGTFSPQKLNKTPLGETGCLSNH